MDREGVVVDQKLHNYSSNSTETLFWPLLHISMDEEIQKLCCAVSFLASRDLATV